MEMWELKYAVSEIKNSLNDFNIRLDPEEEKRSVNQKTEKRNYPN